jgi:hypothetical protein
LAGFDSRRLHQASVRKFFMIFVHLPYNGLIIEPSASAIMFAGPLPGNRR